MTKIGGNFYERAETFGAIQGTDQDVTSVISPDVETLLRKPSTKEEKVPLLEELLAANIRGDIENLCISDAHTYAPRNFILFHHFFL